MEIPKMNCIQKWKSLFLPAEFSAPLQSDRAYKLTAGRTDTHFPRPHTMGGRVGPAALRAKRARLEAARAAAAATTEEDPDETQRVEESDDEEENDAAPDAGDKKDAGNETEDEDDKKDAAPDADDKKDAVPGPAGDETPKLPYSCDESCPNSPDPRRLGGTKRSRNIEDEDSLDEDEKEPSHVTKCGKTSQSPCRNSHCGTCPHGVVV